jgi:hypothetical protein
MVRQTAEHLSLLLSASLNLLDRGPVSFHGCRNGCFYVVSKPQVGIQHPDLIAFGQLIFSENPTCAT